MTDLLSKERLEELTRQGDEDNTPLCASSDEVKGMARELLQRREAAGEPEWVSVNDALPDPTSDKRVCAYTPSEHADLQYRSLPASLFKAVCSDATYWHHFTAPGEKASPPLPVVPHEVPESLKVKLINICDLVENNDEYCQDIWNACRAAMLQSGNYPAIPEGSIVAPRDLLEELRDWAFPRIEDYCDMWKGRRDDEFPALRKLLSDAANLLAAAPQPGKGM